jgi:GMP synthase (glutamine-hydrolysing)
MTEFSKKAVAFRHIAQEHLGSFEQVLRTRGYEIIYVDTPKDYIDRDLAMKADLLFVLGGPLGVYLADLFPFLHEEVKILEARLAQNKPCFGACLGSQLMARALGAEVYLGHQGREVGWKALQFHKDGLAKEFFTDTPLIHWHSDTFDLPKGAELIASTDQYAQQVFSYGNSYGFQCHPEVTDRQLQEWMILFVGHLTGKNASVDIQTFRQQTQEYATRLKQQARGFLNGWIDSIEGSQTA